MRLEILNGTLGIAGINDIRDIGEERLVQLGLQFGKAMNLNDLAFFYMKDRDWIVINKAHESYEFYLDIIQSYLQLSESLRQEAINLAPHEVIRDAFFILDGVIRNRAQIY